MSSDCSLAAIAQLIADGKAKNVVVLTGAGISTAAGIPDFRSSDTGLYNNLQSFNLPAPEAIFDISYFVEHPKPFYVLAKELYPVVHLYKPTLTHYFIRLLADKSLLLRNFTQNIDTLEHAAGVSATKVVEAHGSFSTAHCLNKSCRKAYRHEELKTKIFADEIPRCVDCDGLVKPDIVFFGEGLPKHFFERIQEDMSKADLLLVMGTSLQVSPFNQLINYVKKNVPRVLINLEEVGVSHSPTHGFDFEGKYQQHHRDVFFQGTCDDGTVQLARYLGWHGEISKDELQALYAQDHKVSETSDSIDKKEESELVNESDKEERSVEQLLSEIKQINLNEEKEEKVEKKEEEKKEKEKNID